MYQFKTDFIFFYIQRRNRQNASGNDIVNIIFLKVSIIVDRINVHGLPPFYSRF